LEADDVVGGISRTVERDGWRFDIGGHRFFTKVPEVDALWHRLLDDERFVVRPRMSRIYYDGKFFDYPLRAGNALRNLGVVEAVRCVGSYVRSRVQPPGDRDTYDGWVTARFGRRLYEMFFRTYTEKVWGVPANTIRADWAAQRIKNLSLAAAAWNAISPRGRGTDVTSLIEEFHYPLLGPGMMWEACRDMVEAAGGDVRLSTGVVEVHHAEGLANSVVTGSGERIGCRAVVSSMPLGALVHAMRPEAPSSVREAARRLRHRDFLTVALVVPEGAGFPDNWIYVHSPDVRLGRVQNFGAWSPHMVRPGSTCLGLEYFVDEGDWLWEMPDDELVAFARAELGAIGLVDPAVVERGYVVRMPKAYPVYDATYQANVDHVRGWMERHVRNVVPVGRNGMHRYNNQDHSMLTAMLAVENLVDGASHDLWSVNVDEEYHEEQSTRGSAPAGTGRSAPVLAPAS
jgi:protoporphyrinogen oxidase